MEIKILFLLINMLFVEIHNTYAQTTATPCTGPADIVFVIDGSESISTDNFNATLEFVVRNLDEFTISEAAVRIAALIFSNEVYDNVTFTPYRNKLELAMMIRSFDQPKQGTNTEKGLAKMLDIFTTRPTERANIPKVSVVITDGESRNPPDTVAKAAEARANGISMIAVGVAVQNGSSADKELQDITGTADNVLLLNGYDDLQTLTSISSLSTILCQVATTTTTTTSTTTTTPTTTTTSLALSTAALQIDPLCEGCIIDDKFGYNSYQGDCTRFVHCYPNGTNIAAKDKKCGLGQFWSQEVLTCVDSLYVDCPSDPCKSKSAGDKYDLSENCNAFWTCFSGRSVLVCCSAGERFNATENRCVADTTCTDKCREVPNNPIIACNFEVDSTDDRYFYVNISGWSYRPRQQCACGTRYNPATCSCDLLGACNANQNCEPIVYMDINGTIRDKQGQELPVGKLGATVGSGSSAELQFDGNGALNIWRLAMYDFKQSLAIRFSLKIGTTSTMTEQVLFNCLHGNGQRMDPSIDIKFDPVSMTLVHKLITADGPQTLNTNMQNGTSVDVMYVYDGSKFIAYSDPNESSVPLTGDVKRRVTGIVMGQSTDTTIAGLNGEITNLKIYDCIPDDIKNVLTNI